MSNRQNPDSAVVKPAETAPGQDGVSLSPQVQSIKESLEKYLRPPMNEAGVSERHRNNIIAYGVNECAKQFDRGVDRIVFAGVHKVKNLVVIETNVKYTSIMYDAVAASKVDSKESLQKAEELNQQAHGAQTQDAQSQSINKEALEQQLAGLSR